MKKLKIIQMLFALLTILCICGTVNAYSADGSEDESTTEVCEESTETTSETISETISETTSEIISETVSETEDPTETTTGDSAGIDFPSDESRTEATSKTAIEELETTTRQATEKPTAETTTETTTEATTETTTNKTEPVTQHHDHSSGGGGGGGSGGTGGGVFRSNFSELADKQKTEAESETEITTQSASNGINKKPDEKFLNILKQKKLTYFIDSPLAWLDKRLINIVYSPYIQKHSSSALISVRSLQSGLGSDAEITWLPKTKTAVVKYGAHTAKITANSSYLIADGKNVRFKNGAYAEIKDGRIYLPFRALGEALGFKVSWDSEKRAAVYFIPE